MNWRHPSINIWNAGDYEIRLFRHPYLRSNNKYKAYWNNVLIDRTNNSNTLIGAVTRCEEHLAARLQAIPESVAA